MKNKIVQKDDPVLRKKAALVAPEEIGSKKIRDVIARMKKAMHAEDDGVAIAAPQIGESLQIFVVNSAALASVAGEAFEEGSEPEDLVFINPEIVKLSQKKRRMEEGCLSVRWLYGEVMRSEKATIKAYNEKGEKITRGAGGLLAQIFQHEIDHLNGILFIDKAKNLRDLPPVRETASSNGTSPVRFVFFGSSKFSEYVLDELERAGLSPLFTIDSARDPLPMEKLKKSKADVFIVASFGKILSKEVLDIPKHGTLNVHPSLLPRLRGASPIQNTILSPEEEPGVTIIKMDEKMDHGPIIAQAKVPISPWPDHYAPVEEKLARAGGEVLAAILPKWINGELEAEEQEHAQATFTKLVKKEDGLLDLSENAETNLRKVLAYSVWPGAHMIYKNKRGQEIRVVVKDAKVEDGVFVPARVIPAGKKEMDWQSFLNGQNN